MPHQKPKYRHDCDRCRYLGTVAGPSPRHATKSPHVITADLWVCPNAESLGPSVIARYSDKPSNYSSSPVSLLHKETNPLLLWANALLVMESIAGVK